MIALKAYCTNNLGDDLFIQTIVRRYPEQTFFLTSESNFTDNLKHEPNLICPGRFSVFFHSVLKKLFPSLYASKKTCKLQKADALVRIGGSIFIEREGSCTGSYRKENQHVFILGANFGPYYSDDFLKYKREELSKTDDCCFRDYYSYLLFHDLPSVRYAPDILFGCPFLPEPVDGDNIGISVIDFSNRQNLSDHLQLYEDSIVKLCDYWCKSDKHVSLLGFCVHEGDESAIDRIYFRCANKKHLNRVIYRGDTTAFLRELNQCHTIFASRFHAMILGWTMRKTVVPIIYSAKQMHVISDIGFSGPVWNVLDGQPMNNDILYAKSSRLDSSLLNHLAKRAGDQFKALDAYLNQSE